MQCYESNNVERRWHGFFKYSNAIGRLPHFVVADFGSPHLFAHFDPNANHLHKKHYERFISHGGKKGQTTPIITADSNRDNAVIPLRNRAGSCVYCIKTPFKTSACYSTKTTMHACLYPYTYSHSHMNCQNNVIVNVKKYICAKIKWSTVKQWEVERYSRF